MKRGLHTLLQSIESNALCNGIVINSYLKKNSYQRFFEKKNSVRYLLQLEMFSLM